MLLCSDASLEKEMFGHPSHCSKYIRLIRGNSRPTINFSIRDLSPNTLRGGYITRSSRCVHGVMIYLLHSADSREFEWTCEETWNEFLKIYIIIKNKFYSNSPLETAEIKQKQSKRKERTTKQNKTTKKRYIGVWKNIKEIKERVI